MGSAIIETRATVNVNIARARRWFLELETHPERYQFETHAGFTFTQGNFGEIGARFQTLERFRGLELTLRFELTEVSRTYFRFRLVRPPLPVWSAFVLEREESRNLAGDATNLRLQVGSTNGLGAALLQLPPVRDAVQGQIDGEVRHIKVSMENTYQN